MPLKFMVLLKVFGWECGEYPNVILGELTDTIRYLRRKRKKVPGLCDPRLPTKQELQESILQSMTNFFSNPEIELSLNENVYIASALIF